MTLKKGVTIRDATILDRDFLVECQINMADETENLALDFLTVQMGVEAVMSDTSRGFYIIAEVEGNLAGCLMVTPEWSDWRNRWVWWLQSVYVLPHFRQNGIFGTMYDYVKNKVLENNQVAGIRLYVDKSNQKAQMVYERSGMDGGHYTTYEWMKSNN